MRKFVLASSIVVFSSLVTATAGMARPEALSVSAVVAAIAAERTSGPGKLAMGPTSAPQKPGGTGQEADVVTPKFHKKIINKRKPTVSFRRNRPVSHPCMTFSCMTGRAAAAF
jgi:hypothetical protein